ncbi:MAG: retroviral-like aspartic protease family protein [Xanthobacteraceae bacterium]
MHRVSSFITATVAIICLFYGTAKAEDWPTCKSAAGTNAIAACSRLISAGGLEAHLLAVVYNDRAVARLAALDLDGAIADLDQALRLNAKLAIAYSNRCLARLVKNNIDDAFSDCNEAILRDPTAASAFGFRCGAHLARGDVDHALADCDAAIRLNPELYLAYSNRCFARTAKGMLEGAITDCDQAIRLKSDQAAGYGNRCGVRLAQGNNAAAFSDCNRALELDPNYTAALVRRGLLFERSDDRSRAIADFQDALARPAKYLTGKSFQDTAREHLTALGARTDGRIATEQTSIINIPLEAVNGAFVVPVEINGVITLNFVVDSGAADVSIPSDVVSTLMRTGTIERSDFIGTQTYVLADGSESPSNTFIIRSLKVGNTRVENVTGSVSPAKGGLLLGQSFLQRFKSWSMNNATHHLVLELP